MSDAWSGVDRERWARVLASAAWLFVVAYVAIIAVQIDRARRTTQSSFDDGVWGQRIEQVSFAALPQNLMVLVPGALLAIAAVAIGRGTMSDADPWLDRLARAVAGTAFVALVLAILGAFDVVVLRDPDPRGDFADLLNRAAGAAIAVAMIRLCLHAERSRTAVR